VQHVEHKGNDIKAYTSLGARCRWRSWLRYYATSRKVAASIPDGGIEIFH
jgi:hypothetical protein